MHVSLAKLNTEKTVPEAVNEPQPTPQPYYPLLVKRRPLGVTILAVLEVIVGLILLLASLGSFILVAMWNNPLVQNQLSNFILPGSISGNMELFFVIAGVVTLIIAVFAFVLAYGFIQGKKWAWTIGIAVGVISMAGSIISTLITGFDIMQIGSLVISVGVLALIIYYLYQPGVKAWFAN